MGGCVGEKTAENLASSSLQDGVTEWQDYVESPQKCDRYFT